MKKKKKPNCKGTTPCGFRCLPKGQKCWANLPPEAQQLANQIINQIVTGRIRSKTGGVGASTMNQNEVEELIKPDVKRLLLSDPTDIIEAATKRGIQELLDAGYHSSGKPGEPLNDDDVEALADGLWELVGSSPDGKKLQAALRKKGSLAKGGHYVPATDTDPETWGNPTTERGKLILRRFIEQNGKDGYTGLPIDLMEADLEHIDPTGSKFGGQIDHPDNWVLISRPVNQSKKNMMMADFYATVVEPEAAAAAQDANYWVNKGAKATQKQANLTAVEAAMMAKPIDSFTEADIKQYNKQTNGYYGITKRIAAELGEPRLSPSVTLSRPGNRKSSGTNLQYSIGGALTAEVAEAARSGDRARIKQLADATEELTAEWTAISAKKKAFVDSWKLNRTYDTSDPDQVDWAAVETLKIAKGGNYEPPGTTPELNAGSPLDRKWQQIRNKYGITKKAP